MESSEEPLKYLTIDERLTSYRSFFDHSWSKRVMDATAASPLKDIVFNLCVAWRGIANTFVFPWLMLTMLKSFADGMAKDPDPMVPKWIQQMREHLVAEMGGLSHMKQKQLHEALRKMDVLARETVDRSQYSLDLQSLWETLLKNHELHVGIWESQRLCYGALYYAYENFLTRSCKIAVNDPSFRIERGKKASNSIARALGETARDYCWSHPQIHAAREVRHALVHNGGHMTDNLLPLQHDIKVAHDELHIMAPDTIALHTALKARVDYLVELILRTATM